MVLVLELWASQLVDRHSVTCVILPALPIVASFWMWSCIFAQGCLLIVILLPMPPNGWDYKPMPPSPAYVMFPGLPLNCFWSTVPGITDMCHHAWDSGYSCDIVLCARLGYNNKTATLSNFSTAWSHTCSTAWVSRSREQGNRPSSKRTYAFCVTVFASTTIGVHAFGW
jgi:hypothetical protein